jgi:hypothetical protein
MNTNALAATQFLDDRLAAGLPIPTADQVKRAQRMVDGNPTLRSHRTPLDLQMLALNVPLTRKERMANRRSEEDGGLGLTLRPDRVRFGDAREIEASPEAVRAYVEANPHLTGQEAASAIAQMHGYTTTEAILRITSRVRRFGEAFAHGKRFPAHIRQKMLCLSAMAQAIKLCEERDAAAEEGQADGQ